MSASSTERLSEAWQVEQIPPGSFYGKAHRLPQTGAAWNKALRELLSNRAKVEEIARKLPVTCLAVVEALLESDGAGLEDDIVTDVKLRTGRTIDDLSRAVHILCDQALVVRLTAGKVSRLALVEPAANFLGGVRGITIPTPPDTLSPTNESTSGMYGPRDLVALATLTGHRAVRMNMDESPNRANLKTFCKGIGLEVAPAERLLHEALMRRLVFLFQELYRPQMAELERVSARGTLSCTSSLEQYVPASGWVALEAIARARTREDQLAYQWRTAPVRWKYLIHETGGLDVAEHEGMTFVRRPFPTGAMTGDGHVTPNLEVMLGPGAHLGIVAAVGLSAELVRLDKVLTFRITPESVRDGLAYGMTSARFLEALDRVGRHAVPDAVKVNVESFAKRAVTIEDVVSVRVPTDASARVRAALGSTPFEEPAPGVFLVATSLKDAFTSALTKAGLSPLSPVLRGSAHKERAADPTKARLIPSEFAERFAEAKRTKFRADDEALRKVATVGDTAPAEKILTAREPHVAPADDGNEMRLPRVGELPRASPDRVLRELSDLARDQESVLIEYRAASGPRVVFVALTRLLQRGNDFVVLGENLDTDETLSIRVNDILGFGVEDDDPVVYPPPAAPQPNRKIGRNEACPCGSGKKYKKCHG